MALLMVVLGIGSSHAASGDVVTPRLELTPARYAQEVAPGHSTTVTIKANNLTGRSLDVRFIAIDLEAGDSDSFAQAATGEVPRSATGWLTFDRSRHTLKPHEVFELPVQVDVPDNATPGAYAVAVAAMQEFSALTVNGSESVGSKVQVRATVGSTLVFAVPGATNASAKITAVDAPRFVWGDSTPKFTARVENDGNTLLKLEGATELSAFGAFASRKLKSDEYPTLPGGERRLEMKWTDRPWVGWFQPQLIVVGGAGSNVRIERDLPTIFVLPPWWMLALLVVAIALVVRSSTARRRRIREFREQLIAARLDRERGDYD
jgi:hypothetical protein